VPLAKAFEEMGFKIYATEHTAEALQAAGIKSMSLLRKVTESSVDPNILDTFKNER